MSSGGSGPSLPATPDTAGSSQQQAISRPSRPFSPSPPKETRHTASRPVSLYLGRALPSASVSTPNLSAYDFSSLGGASGLPRREEGYRSIYDGLAKHEPQGEDVFGFGERRSRKGSRVGQPGEVDRTTATAELAIPRGNLEMMRSRSSDSSTSSASPPLGSTSILAALAASDPSTTPDLPSPSSPGPRSPRYSLPAEHFPGSPASHHSARSSRTSYSHSFYGQSSKSMPRLHQPTVVRSTSGRGVSFVPPPAKLASSSSSSTFAQPRASRASMPPQSRLWSPDIADDDAGSPLSGIGGASSIGGMSRATSYFGELGAPIGFPPPAKAYTGSVDAVDVEGSIEQRHVIRVNQGKEIDIPAQERITDEMDQEIRDGKLETIQDGIDQPDLVPPVTTDGQVDPEVADREHNGIVGLEELEEDLNVTEQELWPDRDPADVGDGDGLETTTSARTAQKGEGEKGTTESGVDRKKDAVIHEQDTSSDTPSTDPESDVSATEGDVYGDVGATLAVEEADRRSAEFVSGAKGDEEIERAKPEQPVGTTSTMRDSEVKDQQINPEEPAQDRFTATTSETSVPVNPNGPAETMEASDLGLAASATESEIDNGDTSAVAEDDMSSVEITSSDNRDDPHSLDSKCEGGPAIAEDRVQAPSGIDGAIVDADATEPAPWGTATTTPIPATPDQREAMRGEKIDKEQQPKSQSDLQSAVGTTGTSFDAGQRATEIPDASRDSLTPTEDAVEAGLQGDAILRQHIDSGRADQALSDKLVRSEIAPVEVPGTDHLEIDDVGGRSGQTTPSLPATPIVHAADEQITVATPPKSAEISEQTRSTLPRWNGTADTEQPNLARETDPAGELDSPARTADSYNVQPRAPLPAQQVSANGEIFRASEHPETLAGTSSPDMGDDQIGSRLEAPADDIALTKPRDEELDNAAVHYTASPQPSKSPALPVSDNDLIAGDGSSEQAGNKSKMLSVEDREPESTLSKSEAEQRAAAMAVAVIPGRGTEEEMTLHEVEERQIRQAPLAPAAKPADCPAAPDPPAPMQITAYIPPYKARRPDSARTYHLSPPAQGSSSNTEDNHIAFTVLAGISRQSRTDPLSLTIPHLELHLAWDEPKTWLWVPARRYIPDLALTYVPSGKEVMLSTPEDRARTNETERQRGMARAIIGGVIGRLPVVWRLAGWI